MIDEIIYTGTQIAYYKVCKRKLWLFSKGLSYESENEYVSIGKLIDEIYYKREKERMPDDAILGRIKIDYISLKEGVVINEVKKSKKLDEAHKIQVKYYIWALRKLGVNVVYAILRYPKLRKTEKVLLSENDIAELERAFRSIRDILNSPTPPSAIKKPYCKKCAYYTFCYG